MVGPFRRLEQKVFHVLLLSLKTKWKNAMIHLGTHQWDQQGLKGHTKAFFGIRQSYSPI